MSHRTWVCLALLSGLLGVLVFALPGRALAPAPPVKKHGTKFTNSVGMQLVLVPKGKFKMGSPKDEKGHREDEHQHEVEISKPFYMGTHEVTQGQFKKVMGYNPSYFSKDGKGQPGGAYRFSKPAGGAGKVTGLNTTDFSVENVSWEDAVEFCKNLSALPAEKAAGRQYRLPTEAEWEYACRGGEPVVSIYPFGNSISPAAANYGDYSKLPGSLGRTCKVGSYKPNKFGLYDMAGNVWEWCSDWYGSDYYGKSPKVDPQGPATGTMRVFRGGCWQNTESNLRVATRTGRSTPNLRNSVVGMRAVAVVSGR
jgi:formylglycine-generating enzyme required for sulfatase activity